MTVQYFRSIEWHVQSANTCQYLGIHYVSTWCKSQVHVNLTFNSTMENIQDYVVFDIESGTYFAAANTVLINWKTLNEEQREIMIEGSDTERVLLAEEIGIEYK